MNTADSNYWRQGYGLYFDATTLCLVRAMHSRGRTTYATLYAGASGTAAASSLAAIRTEVQADILARKAFLAAEAPLAECVTRRLSAPVTQTAKALQVLPSIFDVELPFPLENCIFGFADIRRLTATQTQAVAVAALKPTLTKRLELCATQFLEPLRLEHAGCALWAQSMEEVPPSNEKIRVVAHWRADGLDLAMGRDGHLTGAHACRLTVADAAEPVPGTPAFQMLLQHAGQILKTALPELADQPALWLWCGKPAENAALLNTAQQLLPAWPKTRFTTAAEPGVFMAKALAGSVWRSADQQFNFRTAEFTHPMALALRHRQAQRSAGAYLAAGLALCIANYAFQTYLGQHQVVVQTELTRTARQLTGLPQIPKGQEVLLTQRALQDQTEKIRPFTATFQPGLSALLADLLRQATASGVQIQDLSLKPDAVELKGSASDWDQPEKLAAWLRTRKINAQLERRDAGQDERVHFILQGTITP